MTPGQKQQVPGGGLQLSDLPVQRQHQLPGGVLRTLGNGAGRHPPLGLPQGTTCKVQPHSHHLLWDPHFVSKVSVCPQPSPSGSWCLPQSQSSFAGCPARRLGSSGCRDKGFQAKFFIFCDIYYLAAAHRIYIVVHGLFRSMRASLLCST